MAADAEVKKPAGSERFRALWPEIRELIRPRQKLLAIGFVLMLINRVSGLVLPASTKFLIDDIIGKQRRELLLDQIDEQAGRPIVDVGADRADPDHL